jgi:ABC-2 type transport system permease protein
LKIFWSFARQAFQFISVYRFNFFMEFILTILRMYAIYWVWRILYTQRPGAFGVTMEQMATYGMMGMVLELFIWSRPQWYMATQVKSGAIDTDLMKPLDFHIHMLARSVGEMVIGVTVLAVPALVIGYLFLDLQFPPDVWTGLLSIVSVLLGFLLFFHLNFILGSLAVIALDIRHINWAYFSLVRFFGRASGAVVVIPAGRRCHRRNITFQGNLLHSNLDLHRQAYRRGGDPRPGVSNDLAHRVSAC